MSIKNNLKQLMICGTSLLIITSLGMGVTNVSAHKIHHYRTHVVKIRKNYRSRKLNKHDIHKAKKHKRAKTNKKAKKFTNKTNNKYNGFNIGKDAFLVNEYTGDYAEFLIHDTYDANGVNASIGNGPTNLNPRKNPALTSDDINNEKTYDKDGDDNESELDNTDVDVSNLNNRKQLKGLRKDIANYITINRAVFNTLIKNRQVNNHKFIRQFRTGFNAESKESQYPVELNASDFIKEAHKYINHPDYRIGIARRFWSQESYKKACHDAYAFTYYEIKSEMQQKPFSSYQK